MGRFPLTVNAILLAFLVENVNPYFDVMILNLCIDFYNKLTDSDIIIIYENFITFSIIPELAEIPGVARDSK
jgi:hypothetical protein